MSTSHGLAAVLAGLLLLAMGAGSAVSQDGLAVSRVTLVERLVEQRAEGEDWRQAQEGLPLRVGERLRTAQDAVARIELPWMAITVSPGSVVALPDAFVLSAVLEQGRVQLHAAEREVLKLVTAEAEVRGRGEAVVRREAEATTVVALAGRFLVEGSGTVVALERGKGTIVRPGRAPAAPMDTPPPPDQIWPASDPAFVASGDPIALTWRPLAPSMRHHVQVLPVGGESVLIDRDVASPPWRVTIPWFGAFRWRVSTRDERGLESLPSAEGLICVDEE